jgi:hypothetical protein
MTDGLIRDRNAKESLEWSFLSGFDWVTASHIFCLPRYFAMLICSDSVRYLKCVQTFCQYIQQLGPVYHTFLSKP